MHICNEVVDTGRGMHWVTQWDRNIRKCMCSMDFVCKTLLSTLLHLRDVVCICMYLCYYIISMHVLIEFTSITSYEVDLPLRVNRSTKFF